MSNYKRFLLFLLVLITPSILWAGVQNKKMGVGFLIGDPTGLTFKSWISNTEAVDAAIAWSFNSKEKLTLQVALLRHNFDKIHLDKGVMPFYYGLGSRLKVEEGKNDELKLGIRGVGGLEYIFDTVPVEIFFEISPVLEIIPDISINIAGGIGMRYYY